jgi:hypothetical protein
MKKFRNIAFFTEIVYTDTNKDYEMANNEDIEEYRALQIRFPLSLYEKIQERAKKERRSINAEVVYCLEKFFVSDAAQAMSADDLKSFITHLLYPGTLPK